MKVYVTEFGPRARTVVKPLQTTGIELVNSKNRADVVLTGRRKRKHLQSRTPVVYRLRGDVWAVRSNKFHQQTLAYLKDRLSYPLYDGVLAPDERLGQKLPVSNTVVPLPIERANYLDTTHTGEELRLLTLTNLDYESKIGALIQYAPVVNAVLKNEPGVWRIGGDGEYADDVAEIVERYGNVEYCGFMDKHAALDRHNLMLHLSNADIQRPNAILEGVASNLPALTNPFEPFQNDPISDTVSVQDMNDRLRYYQNPANRQAQAQAAKGELKQHTPERIGEQLKTELEKHDR